MARLLSFVVGSTAVLGVGVLGHRRAQEGACAAEEAVAASPAASPAASSVEHHRVVIAGAGTGGITVAAQLARKLPAGERDIVVLDAAQEHFYQPAWTLVGGGLYAAADTVRAMASVIPSNVRWRQSHVQRFEPENNLVHLSDGSSMHYDYLVVATGVESRWPVPGAGDASQFADNVCSIYGGAMHATRTFVMLSGLKPGDSAIFTQPPTPIKCGGAPQKILYLADDLLRRKGIRSQVKLSFIIPQPKIFGVDYYAAPLAELAARRDIEVQTGMELVEVRAAQGKAVFKNTADQSLETRDYTLLHIVPHMGAHAIIRTGNLANEATGYCDVDKGTLQHVRYPNVFSLGDVANLPTSKTAAAISSQAPVLVNNLLRVMQNKSLNAQYDGYTSCPIITGKNSLILAEFKYGGEPKESFPVDQRKERWEMALLKRFVFPPVYWHLFLAGRWYGPNALWEPKFPEQ